MVGVILLLISLLLYFIPRYKYLSYLIYLSFMLGYGGGFGITTDKVIGIHNMDLAVVYTIIITAYLLINNQYKLPSFRFVTWYKIFLIFLLCSCFFSFLYYNFSFLQIVQGARSFILILAFPILIRITPEELRKILYYLFLITLITSILYILQIVVGRPLMPYDGKPHIDESVGLLRMYNVPALLTFFLSMSFVFPECFGKQANIYRVVFFTALICTMGRTGIFSSLMVVVLCLVFLGRASKVLKTIAILGILFLPFWGLVSDRFSAGETSEDIAVLSSGAYKDFDYSEGGTMTYRIAWVYERFDYLLERPLGEKIFGLGMISDSQPIVNEMYHFKLGLRNSLTHKPMQMTTPDIAYGNLISRFGFLGTFIYLCMLVHLVYFIYKNRKKNILFIIAAAQSIMLFVDGLAGSTFSNPQTLAMYFVIMSTILNNQRYYRKNIEFHHNPNC